MTPRRLSLTLAMLVAGTALLVASAPAGEAPKGGTLRITSTFDVASLDTAGGNPTITDASCATLFRYGAGTGETSDRVVPEAARRFTVSGDGLTFTFELRRTFRFHTGVRVTARSFADALHRVANPALASPGTSFMQEIVGLRAVTEGKAQSISGVRVLAPYRLRIRLTKPAEDFTARLTLPYFCPIPPDTPIDKVVTLPAGSGPYYVAERVVNQRIVLKRNPFYRGGRPANVDELVWTIGGTLRDCQRAVEEDRTDFCGEPGAPRDAWRTLAEKYGINRPGGQLFVSPVMGTWFYAFNHNRPAFRGAAQIPLKKAINFAIDRPELARTFGYLFGKRTDQMLPLAFARAESIYPLGGASPAVARRWYAKARFQPTKLVLYTWNLPPMVAQAQILGFNLRQLGIELEVKFFDTDAVYERANTPGEPFDIVLGGWAADYPDPWGFFGSLLDPSTGPLRNTVDPRVLRRMAAVNRLKGDARRRAWADLDVELMRNNPPWAPVVHHVSRMLVSPSLGCFRHHPILTVDITALCKKR